MLADNKKLTLAVNKCEVVIQTSLLCDEFCMQLQDN